MTERILPSLEKSQEALVNNKRNRKIAAYMAGALIVGGSALGIDKGIQETKHENRLEVLDLAHKTKDLNKMYREEHTNALNYTFKTIEAGEPNPTFVAIELGAKDVGTVAHEIDVQTSVIIDGTPRNSMHPGQVVVVANKDLNPKQ